MAARVRVLGERGKGRERVREREQGPAASSYPPGGGGGPLRDAVRGRHRRHGDSFATVATGKEAICFRNPPGSNFCNYQLVQQNVKNLI